MALAAMLAGGVMLHAQEPDLKTLQTQFDDKISLIELNAIKQQDGLFLSYTNDLQKVRARVQQAGELDKLTVVFAEIERAENEKILPFGGSEVPELKELFAQYQVRLQQIDKGRAQAILNLAQSYDRMLEALQRRLTQEGEIEAARTVQDERKQLLATSVIVGARTVIESQAVASGARNGADAPSPGKPQKGRDWISPATGMEFVWIEALNMWVGKYEVTNVEYRRKERQHHSGEFQGRSLNGDRQPVVKVSFTAAREYAEWLTKQDHAALGGARYRLPGTNEWQAFAQCGKGWEYPWDGGKWPPRKLQAGNYHGLEGAALGEKISNYSDDYPVACDVEKSWANPWGLYGVGGNVWEACASDNTGVSFGAWRGASWGNGIRNILLVSSLHIQDGSTGGIILGFRLVLARP